MITRSGKILLMNTLLNNDPPKTPETAESKPYIGIRGIMPITNLGNGDPIYPIVYTDCAMALPSRGYYWLSIPFDNSDFMGDPSKIRVWDGANVTYNAVKPYSRDAGSWGGKIMMLCWPNTNNVGSGCPRLPKASFDISFKGYDSSNISNTISDSLGISQLYEDGKLKTLYTGTWSHWTAKTPSKTVAIVKVLPEVNIKFSNNIAGGIVQVSDNEMQGYGGNTNFECGTIIACEDIILNANNNFTITLEVDI